MNPTANRFTVARAELVRAVTAIQALARLYTGQEKEYYQIISQLNVSFASGNAGEAGVELSNEEHNNAE